MGNEKTSPKAGKSLPLLFVVMGVSGSGKTTIGIRLAERIGAEFVDADDYHSQSNKDKMHRGIPLTDEDRWPWLEKLNGMLQLHARNRTACILACSALRNSYRTMLARGIPAGDLQFILLEGTKEMIAARLAERKQHFMNADLLNSQFATLEEPSDAVNVLNDCSPDEVVDRILEKIPSRFV